VAVTVGNGNPGSASTSVVIADGKSKVLGIGVVKSPAGAFKLDPAFTGVGGFALLAGTNSSGLGGGIIFRAGKFKFFSNSFTSLTFPSTNKAMLTGSGTVRVHTRSHAGDSDCDNDLHYATVSGAYNFRVVVQDGILLLGNTFQLSVWLRNPANLGDESAKIYDTGGNLAVLGLISVKP
jgi:hypothetical protein